MAFYGDFRRMESERRVSVSFQENIKTQVLRVKESIINQKNVELGKKTEKSVQKENTEIKDLFEEKPKRTETVLSKEE